ncbi:type I secretion system permease/ATPase [Sphingomonas swuensis]|uniref:Type I secretion system permease/ATPase n=2 Tax=Sphingomonas swuensis TaxID=977800 RepID=A0ABP7SSX3_9SPHN
MAQTAVDDSLQAAVRACRRHFVWALAFSALVNLLVLVPMLYMLQVYERVVPTRGGTTLLLLTVILILGLGASSLLDVVRSRLLVRAGVRLDRMLSGTLLDVSLSRPTRGGQRLARQAIREFDVLRQAMTGPAILAILDAPWVPIYILIAFLLHPWIGVLSTVGAVVVVLLAIRNEQLTRERLQRASQSAGQAYSEFEASVANADVVRALGLRRALVAGHLKQRDTMMRLQTEASLSGGGLIAGSRFLRQLLQSLALGLGALLAIDGKISAGAIFASMFIVGRALAPIDQLVGNWRVVVQARGAWNTLNDLLSAREPDIALTHLPRPSGSLEVEQLHVMAEGNQPILQNVNFAVEAGEVVAIVGPSGAGKSTLVRVLAGALAPTHGHVRIDGTDQRNWDPERLAEHVGFMPQEPALFAGSVKENIARFRNRLGEPAEQVDSDAIAAATAAGAHPLIQRLSQGYDHPLGLGGRGLSAGQGQRIALARAMFRSPSILILDEPNSNLDAEGDQQLARSLEQAKSQGTTILLVAHRMSVLPLVDKIMVIQDGRLTMYGARDEVLAKLSKPQPRVAAQVAEAR